jgi:hypothetical protein
MIYGTQDIHPDYPPGARDGSERIIVDNVAVAALERLVTQQVTHPYRALGGVQLEGCTVCFQNMEALVPFYAISRRDPATEGSRQPERSTMPGVLSRKRRSGRHHKW